jgi:hypothetical protein
MAASSHKLHFVYHEPPNLDANIEISLTTLPNATALGHWSCLSDARLWGIYVLSFLQ